MATSRIKGRSTACTGDPEDLTAAQVRTLINVACGSTANPCAIDAVVCDTSPCLGGDLTVGANSIIFNTNDASPQAGTVASLYLENCDINLNVSACDTFCFRVNDVIQATLSATSLDLLGTAKNITLIGSGAVGFIQMAEITDPAAGTASGKFYVKDVACVSKPFFIGEGQAAIDLTTGGSGICAVVCDTTPCLGGDLTIGANSIIFNTDDATPQAMCVAAIYLQTCDIKYNVASANTHVFSVDDIDRFTVNSIGFDMPTGATITWAGSLNRRIVNDTSGFIFEVPMCDDFSWEIESVEQMSLDATTLTFKAGHNVVLQGTGAAGFIQIGEITDPAAGTASGKFYVKDVACVSKPFFIGEGQAAVDLSVGVGDDLGNHTATCCLAIGTNAVTFGVDTTDPAGTVPYINNDACGIQYNVPACDKHDFHVNGALVFSIDDCQMISQGFDINTGGGDFITGAAGLVCLGCGVTLQGNFSDMIHTVTACNSFCFNVACATELIINGSVINAATNTFQEAGVNISPIGLHDIFISAGGLDEVTSGAVATRIVDAGVDRKVLRYMPFVNVTTTFRLY